MWPRRSKNALCCFQMSCCSRRLRRTSPADAISRTELILSKPPRMNGWSWPLQPFQVLGWLLYGYLAIVGFGIYIPLLPLPWSHLVSAVSLTAELGAVKLERKHECCVYSC